MKKIFLPILLLLGILFVPKDTFALTNIPSASGSFYYYINSNSSSGWGGTLPQQLLTSSPQYPKYLYGVLVNYDYSNQFTGSAYINGIDMFMQLHKAGDQGVNSWDQSVPMTIECNSHSNVVKTGTCSVKTSSNQYITYQCNIEYTQNDYPTSCGMLIGRQVFNHSQGGWINFTNVVSDTASLYVQAVYFNAYSKENPSSIDMSETNEKLDSIGRDIIESNEKLTDINDNLTKDDAPSSEEIGGAFADINPTADSTFTGVLTAPFRFVNKLNGTCTPQHFILFHTDITIPCGTTLFWENGNLFGNDEYIGEFPTFWNIFVGGLCIYRLALGVFRAINDALDPQKHDTLGVDV